MKQYKLRLIVIGSFKFLENNLSWVRMNSNVSRRLAIVVSIGYKNNVQSSQAS